MGRLSQRQQQVWFQREYTPEEEARLYRRAVLSPGTPTYEAATSPYITVTVTLKPCSFSVFSLRAPTLWDNTVVKGDVLDLRGTLVDAAGVPLAGKTVELLRDGVVVDSAITDSYGIAICTDTAPTAVGTVTYQLHHPADAEYDECWSDAKDVVVEARVPVLMFDISPTTVLPSEALTWGGGMTDPKVTSYRIAGKSVYLQESPDAVTWTDVAGPLTTDSAGAYSGTYTAPATSGTYYYRSRSVAGSPEAGFSPIVAVEVLDPAYEEAVSPQVEVVVTTEIPPPPPAVPWGAVVLFAGVMGFIYALTRLR